MSHLLSEIAESLESNLGHEDPEDELNDLESKDFHDDVSEHDGNAYQVSSLRSRNAPLLDEEDSRYSGRKISRKSLEDCSDSNNYNEKEEEESLDAEEDDDEDANFSSDENDNEIESFKEKLQFDSSVVDESGNDSSINYEGRESNELEESDESDDVAQCDDSNDVVRQFSHVDIDGEAQKGKAVKSQLELWHKLCECRIRLQKLLGIANKLPQFDTWKEFEKESSLWDSEKVNKGQDCVRRLLSNFTDLQGKLLQSDMEIGKHNKIDSMGNKDENESICSDELIDSEKEEEKDLIMKPRKTMEIPERKTKSRKRKMKVEEYEEFISKQYKTIIPYRNSIIHYWDERTRLASGHMTQKSFNTFDQSALKQINQILLDKQRLIKRTQLKRSVYRVLGKSEDLISDAVQSDNIEEGEHIETTIRRDEHLKDYDVEIFDDEDFYRQLLKDVIESKSIGIDSDLLSKQIEIHKIRSKMKKKVDTKASKGRKIRFDVHPKLVNLMAPLSTCSMSEEARNELFKSLFGQCSTS